MRDQGEEGVAAAESPAAWFALLERARASGDDDLADVAERELERLGVVVGWRRGRRAPSAQRDGRDGRRVK